MSRYRRELGDRLLALRLAAAGRVHQYPEVQALRRFLTAAELRAVLGGAAGDDVVPRPSYPSRPAAEARER